MLLSAPDSVKIFIIVLLLQSLVLPVIWEFILRLDRRGASQIWIFPIVYLFGIPATNRFNQS
jgi:hypothetical protein